MDGSYHKYFTEKSLWQKIGNFASSAGQTVTYAVLLLFYVMKDPGTELKRKITIGAALGYFIFPADAIPDITPLIGFSDDLGVLLFALSQIYTSITPDIRLKARHKLKEWFGRLDEKQIMLLEEKASGSRKNEYND
jgi:uncharacterized membrane protein YkvA (DUF1232 family)